MSTKSRHGGTSMPTSNLPASTPVIAIVGAGFCGALSAVRLLRTQLRAGSRILLIDPSAEFGRGLAYRRGPGHWRLNVPVERMSAFEEAPRDFVEWAHTRDSSVAPGDYLPRSIY